MNRKGHLKEKTHPHTEQYRALTSLKVDLQMLFLKFNPCEMGRTLGLVDWNFFCVNLFETIQKDISTITSTQH